MRLLDGVTVLDLTHAYSGPFCTMHLADHGATVIKIESPPYGDQTRAWPPFVEGCEEGSGYFSLINRNKKGMALNLKTEEGKRVFKDLVRKADVVCENFRSGTMEKLGLGYDDLAQINPGLIYASASGFGTTGPYASRPAYDIVAQGMSGMMSITGFADSPPTTTGPGIGDNYTGTYMALGIAMALYNRGKTGKGYRLEVAMLDTLYSVLEHAVVTYTIAGQIPGRVGNCDPAAAPFDSFEAKDGMFVMAVSTDKHFRILCAAIGKPEMADDPRFISNKQRIAHYESDLRPLLLEYTMGKTIDEMEETLVNAGIPFGRVLNVAEATEHPQIQARNMIQEVDDPLLGKVRLVGIPIKVHGLSDSIERPAPRLGEHNTEVLRSLLGASDADIASLAADRVIFHGVAPTPEPKRATSSAITNLCGAVVR